MRARRFRAALVLVSLVAAPAWAHPLDAEALPTLREYFTLGVQHILEGYDHLLFLAGLAIAARRVRDLLWTISAFTLAHSITLALGMLGIVTPNATVVEVVIALSIAYVGYENLKKGWEGAKDAEARVMMVFGFGLAHGFGFAGAIHEIGLPRDRELFALGLFNLGVEAGQLMVLSLLVPVIARVRRRARVERIARVLVNAALIAAGLVWTVQRTFEVPAAEPATAEKAKLVAQDAATLAAMRSHDAVRQADAAETLAAPAFDRSAVAPSVRALCSAFQTLPRERRAQCTGTQPGVTLAQSCERVLDRSVRSGAIALDTLAAERCVSAVQARYEGCDWITQRVLAPIAECAPVLQGTRTEGMRCASSLECGRGLYCHGAGAFDTGTCGKPFGRGARCELAADPLASYVRNDPAAHRECEGDCVRGHCSS